MQQSDKRRQPTYFAPISPMPVSGVPATAIPPTTELIIQSQHPLPEMGVSMNSMMPSSFHQMMPPVMNTNSTAVTKEEETLDNANDQSKTLPPLEKEADKIFPYYGQISGEQSL